MDVVHTAGTSLDVHKKRVGAGACISGEQARPHKDVRTFSTMTAYRLALSAWLTQA